MEPKKNFIFKMADLFKMAEILAIFCNSSTGPINVSTFYIILEILYWGKDFALWILPRVRCDIGRTHSKICGTTGITRVLTWNGTPVMLWSRIGLRFSISLMLMFRCVTLKIWFYPYSSGTRHGAGFVIEMCSVQFR
jgi:hypothetical protein